jgi:hypothetical protein
MADFTIPVGSYSLTLGLDGAPQGYRRHIWITSHPTYSGAIKWTSIAFVASVTSSPPSSIVGGNQVRAFTALADFDAFHHVLQTESPLYLNVRETNQRLDFLWLGTTQEQIGEGLQDLP